MPDKERQIKLIPVQTECLSATSAEARDYFHLPLDISTMYTRLQLLLYPELDVLLWSVELWLVWLPQTSRRRTVSRMWRYGGTRQTYHSLTGYVTIKLLARFKKSTKNKDEEAFDQGKKHSTRVTLWPSGFGSSVDWRNGIVNAITSISIGYGVEVLTHLDRVV